jgi:hypothetical protein
MISLTVVIVTLGITFGGAYLIYKLNKDRIAHPVKRSPSQRHH